jgi:hypothetical protein
MGGGEPDRDRGLDGEDVLVRLRRRRSREEPTQPEKNDKDLRRDERLRETSRRSQHCEASDQRSNRSPGAMRQQ